MQAPADPRWLTSERIAAAVAALGGGAIAAWLFRALADAFPRTPLDSGWLEVVMFVATALMTARAFYSCLQSGEGSVWPFRCMLYGALNAILCTMTFFPIADYDADATWVIVLCGSPFLFVLGGAFGLAFYLVYYPVLALARRTRAEPSLDLGSRMAPWCAGWLAAIALALTFGPSAQHTLAAACAIASAAVVAWGLLADRRRRAFLAELQHTRHRIAGEVAKDVLPLVGGLGADRAMIVEHASDHGPFRSAAHEETVAALTGDAREHRALRVRQIACGLLAIADAGILASIAALA